MHPWGSSFGLGRWLEALVEHLKGLGVSGALAEWIAQSVRTTAAGVELSYDPDVIRRALRCPKGH